MGNDNLTKLTKKEIYIYLLTLIFLFVYIKSYDYVLFISDKIEYIFPKLAILLLFPLAFILLGPFIFAHAYCLKIAKKIEKNYFKLDLYIGRAIYISIYTFFIIYIIEDNSMGLLDALVFLISNPNCFKIGFIALLCFYFTRKFLSDRPKNFEVSDCFIYSMTLLFLWTLYYKFGMDDGCKSVGGDRLFGGGDYVECDENYKKVRDTNSEISTKNSFNSNALFTAELFIMTLISNLSVIIGYIRSENK